MQLYKTQFLYNFSFFEAFRNGSIFTPKQSTVHFITPKAAMGPGGRGGGTPIHYLYGYVLLNGVVILKLLI